MAYAARSRLRSIRRQLDRLAECRLQAPLTEEQQREYARLCRREAQLIDAAGQLGVGFDRRPADRPPD